MSQQTDLFEKYYKFEDAKKIQAAGIYPFFRPIEDTVGSAVVTHGKRRVMIGSNNYLGLTHHPKVIEAAKKAIDQFGTGCTGSRFLNGNLVIHEELERKLADYLGKEDCIVFATGFLSNLGVIGCLIGRNDVLYCDRDNHASIFEATRVTLGDTIKYKHNDMEDLERVLETTRSKYQGALIVVDGVFSMSGSIVKLDKLQRLAKKYGCRIYVDDAHALGVLGDQGQGTAHHFNLVDEVDLVMGTFSKSFASLGGYVAGNKDIIHWIKHKARSFMFSAAMPPAAVGTVLECLRVVKEEPWHLENLRKNAKKMSTEFERMGYNTLGSQTPVIPLVIGDDMAAFSFAQRLYEQGVFCTPVVKPAVPDGMALIRTSYMASHQDEDLDYVLETLYKLGKEYGLVKDQARTSDETLPLADLGFEESPALS